MKHVCLTHFRIRKLSLGSVSLLKLTCPLNYRAHLSAAQERKQEKPEYQQIVAQLDRLGFGSHYYTIEIGCLGHYLKETVSSMKKVSNLSFSKTRALLDKATALAINSSQRIFFACSNPTWTL